MSYRLQPSQQNKNSRSWPQEQTSYLPLFGLLMVIGIILSVCTVSAQRPGPGSESIGITGQMPGPAPKTAATIDNPRSGQRFATSPVTVEGSCPENTLVEIFKNDIFAGSTACSDKGRYSLQIDLMIGQNILIARVFDALNQQGPDSNAVNIFYDALPPQADPLTPLNFGAPQMILITDAVYRGVFPDKEFSVPLTVMGGTAPYAINVQWGDSNNKVIPRGDNTQFRIPHTYKKPGTYQVTFQATDNQGRVAFLSVASIVNGQPDPAAAAPTDSKPNTFIALWPFFVAAVAVVVAFWLGERREKHILGASSLQRPPVQYHKPV